MSVTLSEGLSAMRSSLIWTLSGRIVPLAERYALNIRDLQELHSVRLKSGYRS